ncbi:dinucleotide transporter 2, mitochondrial [Seminavis robusta]|uniref:Dinucleotide transporter 2, mitochondrial n=1 Tax=Seminavis robusta TaxID=568900 RepID=A0A9N8DXG8_9STRA|nr:dinucleotide transporter 2, mitochondrial [Seminavis robusta]|eukprot:Sro346_g122720.1 dinucleotide transporter 2, mitochondrial (360) ;mRNA; r:43916-44995
MASLVSKQTTRGAATQFVGTEAAYPAQEQEQKKELAKLISAQQQQQQSTLQRDPVYLWSSLFAGVGSGALSSVICAPLDLVRTRLQVWTDLKKAPASSLREALVDIGRTEGFTGYFRGLGAALCTVPAFWGVYFPLYDELKRRWTMASPETQPSLVHCGSAVAAGAVSDLICNPMFVVRTRLQTEALHGGGAPSGIVRTIQTLHQEGGVKIFWRGMSANMMGLSHVAVQFPVYEWLKTALVNQRNNKVSEGEQVLEPTALDLFLASGLSKMTASLLTYPHEVIRSRMMDARGAAGMSLLQTTRRVYAQDGLLGFYSGLPVALIRVIPNCCITFMTYELLLRMAKDEIRKRKEKEKTGSL